METTDLPLTRIGNFRDVRLPADMIRRQGFDAWQIFEDNGYGVVLRSPEAPAGRKMAAGEDWSAWESVSADNIAGQADWSFLLPAAPGNAIGRTRFP